MLPPVEWTKDLKLRHIQSFLLPLLASTSTLIFSSLKEQESLCSKTPPNCSVLTAAEDAAPASGSFQRCTLGKHMKLEIEK